MTRQRLGLGPSCVTLGLERLDAANAAALPAVPVDAAGLSREDGITVLLGGYARELRLYDRDDIAGKGVFFTRLTRSADDAAGVARLLGRPQPNTVPEVERRLVEALIGVRYRPYALLARDLVRFR